MSGIASLNDVRVGDIGFGPLQGGWGSAAMWGEAIADGGFHVGELNIGHVWVVTRSDGHSMQVVEAMPGGARSTFIGAERWGPKYAYCRPPEDYPGQAEDAAAIARGMIGIPYSPASYLALAAWRVDLLKGEPGHPSRLERWIDRRQPMRAFTGMHKASAGMQTGQLNVALPVEVICSVLVDQAWSLTGKTMIKDVAHQCVTPSRLATGLLAMPGALWGGAAFG